MIRVTSVEGNKEKMECPRVCEISLTPIPVKQIVLCPAHT